MNTGAQPILKRNNLFQRKYTSILYIMRLIIATSTYIDHTEKRWNVILKLIFTIEIIGLAL